MEDKQQRQSDIVFFLLCLCLWSIYHVLHGRLFTPNSIFEYASLVVFFIFYVSVFFIRFRKNSTIPLLGSVALLSSAIIVSIGCGVVLFSNVTAMGIVLVLLSGIINACILLLYIVCYVLYRCRMIKNLYLVSVMDITYLLPIWLMPFLMNNIVVI